MCERISEIAASSKSASPTRLAKHSIIKSAISTHEARNMNREVLKEIAENDRAIRSAEKVLASARAVGYIAVGTVVGIQLAGPQYSSSWGWTKIAFIIITILAAMTAFTAISRLTSLQGSAHSGPRSPHSHWCRRCAKARECESPYNCQDPDYLDSCLECGGNDVTTSSASSTAL